MFRGDHPELRRRLGLALRLARDLGHPRTGSEHLLLALTEDVDESGVEGGIDVVTGIDDGVDGDRGRVAAVLAGYGVTPEAVREAVREVAPAGAGAAADRDTLAVLGIDLDRLLGPSGTGTLDRPPVREPLFPLGAAGARRRCARTRPPLGLDAQAAYEASLRLALARREREHRPEHLAMALVALDPGAARVLATTGTDARALLDALAAAFPPPRRALPLRVERRLGRGVRLRDIARRYRHTTGRAVVAGPALASLIDG
ncbi:Clp protease N-terminal domain-containing protein [Streptosporangium sp. NPDC050855]|uniref:Clp protease N-terminal domain-containing protein n=1 Tax=Streptosporangium sp. NPDC050855 TaxID=3366194 RepID=UPI00378FB61C